MKPLAEVLLAFDEIVGVLADDDTVIDVAHVRPFEFGVRDIVEKLPNRRVQVHDLADIVNTHIPFVSRTAKRGVKPPAV